MRRAAISATRAACGVTLVCPTIEGQRLWTLLYGVRFTGDREHSSQPARRQAPAASQHDGRQQPPAAELRDLQGPPRPVTRSFSEVSIRCCGGGARLCLVPSRLPRSGATSLLIMDARGNSGDRYYSKRDACGRKSKRLHSPALWSVRMKLCLEPSAIAVMTLANTPPKSNTA